MAVYPSSAAAARGRGDRVRGVAVGHQQVQTDAVPAPAAQQVPHGRPVVLALDVPEGDVDRADRARERGAPERRGAVVGLPVVLDAERVLPDQVGLEPLYDALHRFRVAPARRLAQPRQPGVGADAHQVLGAYANRLDLFDLHGCSTLRWVRGSQPRSCFALFRLAYSPSSSPAISTASKRLVRPFATSMDDR